MNSYWFHIVQYIINYIMNLLQCLHLQISSLLSFHELLLSLYFNETLSTRPMSWLVERSSMVSTNQLIGLVDRVYKNIKSLVCLGSIPGRVIPKTLEMVLDASLLNTQQYKVRIKGNLGKEVEPPLQ